PGARLLIIRLRSLGDALLLTPALRALKQWRPDLRLSVLMYSRFAPILEGNPDIEELLTLDPEGPAAPLAIARALDDVRRPRFAVCINLHGGTLSALLARASGAPHRLAFGHFRFPSVYTARAPDVRRFFGRERVHSVEWQMGLFYWAGLPPAEIPPLRVFPQQAAKASVTRKLAAHGLEPGQPYAVVHPISRIPTQDWPAERYAALGRVLEEAGLTPVFHCGPGEEAKLDAIERAASGPVRQMRGLSIPELVALIEGAALFVGVDSGPAHIAAALGRPAVVLFGSMDSNIWRPWKAPHEIVQNYYACNPCKGDRCYAFAQPECILSISVEQVRAAVKRLAARELP
ncbi:MAG: glycosyltransferase family 9 protein, partial [Candidatus Acidiferrales bacterium]